MALEALVPLLSGTHAAPGVTADLTVVAGAMVEMGTPPGDAGIAVLRRLRTMGQGAAVFLGAWERSGGGAPPDPEEVTAATEHRVASELGDTAPQATVCWWTIRRHGLAAKTMLSESGARSAVRADPELHAELVAIANQLATALWEFEDVRALLRMAEAGSAVVLDRASGRGFRVLFDGVGDNFQLHTLLADALVGEEGRGLAGHRPDERWTAAFRDTAPDPEASTVYGWWNLVAADGSWVWNEGVPADIPTADGEHLLVLDELPYPRTWSAGRHHPHVRGWLEVEEELTPEETARWWQHVSLGAPEASAAFPSAEPTHAPEVYPQATEQEPAGTDVLDTGTASPGQMFTPAAEAHPDSAEEPATAPEEESVGSAPKPEPPGAPTVAFPAVTGEEDAPAPAEDSETAPEKDEDSDGGTAPGASRLPPLPPGVSDNSGWGPTWL